MIDLTSLKAPGWDRVVAELSGPAADDRAYLERLTRLIGQVSAARQAALFIPGMGSGAAGELSARLLSVWPLPAGSDGKTFAPESLEQPTETKAAAVGAIETSQSRAFGLDQKDGLYDGGVGKGYVLAVPVLGDGGRAAAVITLLIESRSKAAVQSTLAMAEVLAGYVSLHAGRQEIKRMQQAGLSMELATRLIGSINSAPNFKGASLRLVNDLTRQLGADRAAIGWIGGTGGDSIKVVALSDAEKFDTRTKMVRQIADAMDECADQEQAVLFPPPTAKGDLLLAQAVTTAHRELTGGDGRLSLCSVPLRDGDQTLGVLLVELKRKDDKAGGGDAGLDLRGVEVLQAAMDLVTPVLAVKWSDSRMLPRRALGDARLAMAWAVGPKHTVWKGVALLVVAVALFVTFFKIEHRVGATVELRPRMQRTVSAPFEGVVLRLGEGVAPGRVVKKGDLIVELDTRELALQRDQADAKVQQGAKQLSAARRDGKVVEAQMAEAVIAKGEAERSLAAVRIGLARLTAPMDGVVIAGDMRDKIGASVKSGEEMFLIAPSGDLMAVARVDERDIALVKEGAKGKVATRARPSEGFGVTVETVVPMAAPKDGKNLFEVRAKLDDGTPPAWLRPGMEGEVRIDAGKRSLLWIGTRRVVDQIRLWLW